MNTRFKMIAAALGLIVATAAAGDVSAKPVDKTIVKTVRTTHAARPHAAKIVVPAHRVHFGTRIVKHVRIVHRAPRLAKFVGLVKRPVLHKHVMLHRTIVKKTIVR